MSELTPLQESILRIIKHEIVRGSTNGKCELSDDQFLKILKKEGLVPHKNSVGNSIMSLAKKGYLNKNTTSHVGRGWVRTVTLI